MVGGVNVLNYNDIMLMRVPLHTFRSNTAQSDVEMTFDRRGLKKDDCGACYLHTRNGHHCASCRACSWSCAFPIPSVAELFHDHLMTFLFSSGIACVPALQCLRHDSAFESQGFHADIQS